MKTDQDRLNDLGRITELGRADEEIRNMIAIVSAEYGGPAQMSLDNPELFDILVMEVDSIVEQVLTLEDLQ